jgi:hypothetical protein
MGGGHKIKEKIFERAVVILAVKYHHHHKMRSL